MLRRVLRVHRRDSAFLYAILESLEGMASFSTLDHGQNADSRDVEVHVARGFEKEVDDVIEGMRKKFPILEWR